MKTKHFAELMSALESTVNDSIRIIRFYAEEAFDIKIFVEKFLKYPFYNKVTSITLNNLELTNQDVETLCKIFNTNSSMYTINLSSNKIGDLGVKYLTKALLGTKVKEIRLEDNNIGDDGARDLAKLVETNLAEICMVGSNNISPIGAEILLQAIKTVTYPAPDTVAHLQNYTPKENPNFISGMPLGKKQLDTFYKLLDKNNLNFTPETNRALIILGNEHSGKTTLTNLLAHKDLHVSEDAFGNPSIQALYYENYENHDSPCNILTNKNGILLIDSGYFEEPRKHTLAEYNLKLSISTLINSFFINKVLKNYQTKFIVTINNNDLAVNEANENKFLIQIKKLSEFFKNIDISAENIALVVTACPTNKRSEHIKNAIEQMVHNNTMNIDSAKRVELTENDQKIIKYLKESIHIFQTPCIGEIVHSEALDLALDKQYMNIKESNNLNVDIIYKNIVNKLLVNIDKNLLELVNSLAEKTFEKWEDYKKTLLGDTPLIFHSEAESRDFHHLIKMLEKFKNNEAPKNKINNSFQSFLNINKELFAILENKELKVSIDLLTDYYQYFKSFFNNNIKDGKKIWSDPALEMPNKLMAILSNKCTSTISTINDQLLEAFKNSMCAKEGSFNDQLSQSIERINDSVKNRAILALEDFQNFNRLKEIQSLYKKENPINISDLEEKLKEIIKVLPYSKNDLAATLSSSMHNFLLFFSKESSPPQILIEIWQNLINRDFIQNIDVLIKNTITKTKLITDKNIEYYLSIIKELETYSEIYDCSNKIAEAYYYIGNKCYNDQKYPLAIKMYEKSVKADNKYAPAYEKLGDCYLAQKNYKTALEYYVNCDNFYKTCDIFEQAIKCARKGYKYSNDSNEKETLAWIYEKQGEYLQKKNYPELSRMSFSKANSLYESNEDINRIHEKLSPPAIHINKDVIVESYINSLPSVLLGNENINYLDTL